MTHTVEQLKIWSDETDTQAKAAAIAEFEHWCGGLKARGLSAPTLNPNDKHDVAFAGAFHDVVADFEELEAPALRRERNQQGLGHSLTEKLIVLRVLQGAIDECRHRNLRVPREIYRLRVAVSREIYSLRSTRMAGSNDQKNAHVA